MQIRDGLCSFAPSGRRREGAPSLRGGRRRMFSVNVDNYRGWRRGQRTFNLTRRFPEPGGGATIRHVRHADPGLAGGWRPSVSPSREDVWALPGAMSTRSRTGSGPGP